MKPSQLARLDAATPRWPVARIDLAAQPATMEFSGLQSTLDPDDPQQSAYLRMAEETRARGQDLRMDVTNPDATVERFIVRPDGTMLLLDQATPAAALTHDAKQSPAATRKSAAPHRNARKRVAMWGGAIMGVLVVASVVVIATDPNQAKETAPPAGNNAPTPAAATLYTEDPPAGWSSGASWAVPIAKTVTTAALDTKSGTIAVLTPDDRSSSDTADDTAEDIDQRGTNYLSILDEDGRTTFAVELDSPPTSGPAITTVSGQRVVALVTGSELSFWPLNGPADARVDVAIPSASAKSVVMSDDGILVTISTNQLAVITTSGLAKLDALPLTTPVEVTSEGVMSIEEDSGTWWLSKPGKDPDEIAPTPPPGAVAFSDAVCADAQHVVVLWESEAAADAAYKTPGVLAAYDTATGELLDAVDVDSVATNLSSACPTNRTSGLTAGDGFVLSDDEEHATLTLVPELDPAAVADAVYGTLGSDKVQVTADGTVAPQAGNMLTPIAYRKGALLVISQSQLYALPPK